MSSTPGVLSWCALCALIAAPFPLFAQEKDALEEAWSAEPSEQMARSVAQPTVEGMRLKLVSEFGLLSVLQNDYQGGRGATEFDFVEDGGQGLFNPFLRLSAEATWKERHTAIFLYQPIDLRTTVRLDEDVEVNNLVFPEGKTMDLRYGFDFFRATYHFDLFADPDIELGVGGGFQMRIAAVEFAPVDGSEGRFTRNLGPVPLLKVRGRYNWANGYWVGAEVDGFYANVSIANGDTNADVTGAILDGSLRAGVHLRPGLDAFLNLRYIGGGAEGDDPDQMTEVDDGYNSNWLQAVTVSVGFIFEPALVW